MCTFFERLVEERKRKKLNQTDFAALGGVKKGAQINYEAGNRHPKTDYWTLLGNAGVDVAYILTGKRAENSCEITELRPDQQALLDNYENCTPEARKFVARVADHEAQPYDVGQPVGEEHGTKQAG